MKRTILLVPAVAIITIIFGTIYVTGQQILRLDANDPQIQLAQEAASKLDKGKIAESLTMGRMAIDKSLAPFVIVYGKDGDMISGNGYLGQQAPTIPVGALKASEGKEYNAVTWQPQKDVRLAAVSVAADHYYVLSGRNLREVEAREQILLQISALGWAGSLVALLGGVVVNHLMGNRKRTSKTTVLTQHRRIMST